jgi:hypothetical protein
MPAFLQERAMATVVCANCERQLGRLEEPQEWKGNLLCAECYARLDKTGRKQVQTVELTSKKWKLHQLIGFLVAIAGCILFPIGLRLQDSAIFGVSVLALGVGWIWLLWASIMAWWHHG